MTLNREKYYRWAWLLDLVLGKEKGLGGLSARREKLYEVAYSFLGKDASPKDLAPDDLACAESVNAVYKAAFGHEIGGGVSTTQMYRALKNSDEFLEVDAPLFGDIVISPTGYVRSVAVGHVGIVGKWQIMSNNSATGRWEAHYTLQSWRARYDYVRFFRCVGPAEDTQPAAASPAVTEIVEKATEVVGKAKAYPALIAPLVAFLASLSDFLSNLIKR